MIGIIMAGGRGARMAGFCAPQNSIYDDNLDNSSEKLLYSITDEKGIPGIPIVGHTIDAMERCNAIRCIYAIVSEANAPRTRRLLADSYYNIVELVESKGAGYSADLGDALQFISARQQEKHPGEDAYQRGAIIIPGDMPYIDANIISAICSHYAKDSWTDIVITKEYAAMWESSFEYKVYVRDAIICNYSNDSTSSKAEKESIPCLYTGISLVDPIMATTHMPRRHVIIDDHRIAHSFNTPDDYANYTQRQAKL